MSARHPSLIRPETGEGATKQAIADALLAWAREPLDRQAVPMGAEIGIKRGQLSARLLRGRPTLNLIMVDFWRPSDPKGAYARSGDPAANVTVAEAEAWRREAESRTSFAWLRRRIVRADSVEAAALVADETLGLVFLDADHSESGRYRDLAAWAPKLIPGGVLAGGLWTSAYGGDCCARAVRRFLAETGWPATVRRGPARTWYVTKP